MLATWACMIWFLVFWLNVWMRTLNIAQEVESFGKPFLEGMILIFFKRIAAFKNILNVDFFSRIWIFGADSDFRHRKKKKLRIWLSKTNDFKTVNTNIFEKNCEICLRKMNVNVVLYFFFFRIFIYKADADC